jgi:hypothetical protein
MMTDSIPNTVTCPCHASPALAGLGLAEGEFNTLSKQGFVSVERRGNARIHKLRFRYGGRQRVVYLGTNARQAFAVEAELALMQRGVRAQRRGAALHRHSATRLREIKTALQPLLEERGFYFHGRAVRKRRTPIAIVALDKD